MPLREYPRPPSIDGLHRPQDSRLEPLGGGRIHDVFEDAGKRARPVQGALRAAQDLDPRDVEGVEVAGQDGAVGETGARPEGHVVDVHADGRGDAAGVDAAQRDAGLTGGVGDDAQPRHQRHEVEKILDPLLFQRVLGEDRDRLRNLQQRLRPFCRRDDHLVGKHHGFQGDIQRPRLVSCEFDCRRLVGNVRSERCGHLVGPRRQIRDLKEALCIGHGRLDALITGQRYLDAGKRVVDRIRDRALDGRGRLGPQPRCGHHHREHDNHQNSHACSTGSRAEGVATNGFELDVFHLCFLLYRVNATTRGAFSHRIARVTGPPPRRR